MEDENMELEWGEEEEDMQGSSKQRDMRHADDKPQPALPQHAAAASSEPKLLHARWGQGLARKVDMNMYKKQNEEAKEKENVGEGGEAATATEQIAKAILAGPGTEASNKPSPSPHPAPLTTHEPPAETTTTTVTTNTKEEAPAAAVAALSIAGATSDLSSPRPPTPPPDPKKEKRDKRKEESESKRDRKDRHKKEKKDRSKEKDKKDRKHKKRHHKKEKGDSKEKKSSQDLSSSSSSSSKKRRRTSSRSRSRNRSRSRSRSRKEQKRHRSVDERPHRYHSHGRSCSRSPPHHRRESSPRGRRRSRSRDRKRDNDRRRRHDEEDSRRSSRHRRHSGSHSEGSSKSPKKDEKRRRRSSSPRRNQEKQPQQERARDSDRRRRREDEESRRRPQKQQQHHSGSLPQPSPTRSWPPTPPAQRLPSPAPLQEQVVEVYPYQANEPPQEEEQEELEMLVSPLARHTPGSTSSISNSSHASMLGISSCSNSGSFTTTTHSSSNNNKDQGHGPKVELTGEEKVFYKQLVKVVGKCLGKYLKAGKIAREEDHHRLTKKLAYKVLRKEKGNTEMTAETPLKIYKYVQSFFAKFPMYGDFSEQEKERQQKDEARAMAGVKIAMWSRGRE